MFAAHRPKPSRHAPYWFEAIIHEALGGDSWRLDDGRPARQAVSCLVTPQAGDRVLLISTAGGSPCRWSLIAAADHAMSMSISSPAIRCSSEDPGTTSP